MIPFGERNECSKVVFSLMVLRIIMHFWCASSLLCLLSPCLSKVVQWFNVFRYRIPYLCTKPPKFYDHYIFFCMLLPCKASLPKTILSGFMDVMLLEDSLAICFRQIFRGQIFVRQISERQIFWEQIFGIRFSGTDFPEQIFGQILDMYCVFVKTCDLVTIF